MAHIDVSKLTRLWRIPVREQGPGGILKHLFHRQFKEVRAVEGVSFQIQAGEMVGFLGPNGAGKTTTLKMLSGLVHPTSGQVQVAGYTPFDRKSAFLREISLVMGQKEQLVWDLPAMDGLKINAMVYDLSDELFRTRLELLSGMLGLKDELLQPIRKLSLGQRMKAELLAALLHQPSVLFLDEPTLGLDVNAQVAIRDFLRTYNQRFGATILLTSHYMADIAALCSRVLLIHHGRLIFDGPLDALVERFSPFREVKLELREDVSPEMLTRFGEIKSLVGREVELWIGREQLTAQVGRMLQELPVLDLTITDPPLEAIIGKVFDQGSVEHQGASSSSSLEVSA